MKLRLPLSLILAAVPVASSWTIVPRWFGPTLLDTTFSPVLQRQQDFMDRAFSQTSPHYEITNSANELKINMDVPGVKAEDLSVTVEEDGNILHITGHRKLEKDGYSYSSKFSQSFSLDSATELDKFQASLENGVLTITAPKDVKKLESNIRKIPVIQSAEDKLKSAVETEKVDERAEIQI